MRSDIEAFFERQFRLMEAGRIDALSALFKTPLPVYRDDALFIEASPGEVETAVSIIHSSLKEAGVVSITGDVLDIEQKTGTSTVRVSLDIRFCSENGDVLRNSRLFYFLEPCDGTFLISVVDYGRAAFPEIFELLNQQRRLS